MAKLIEELREMKKEFSEGKYYLLSHHPRCEKFENDCYEIKGKKLCIGCFTAYPIALIFIIFVYFNFINLSYRQFITLGVIFGSVQFFSMHKKANAKLIKILIKIFLGIGLGAFTSGIFLLPLQLFFRVILFILCIQISAYFSFFRIKKIHEICKSCEYKEDWENCPGFK